MSQFIIREWQLVTKGFSGMVCGLNSEICFPGLALQQILVAANRSRGLHFQRTSFSDGSGPGYFLPLKNYAIQADDY